MNNWILLLWKSTLNIGFVYAIFESSKFGLEFMGTIWLIGPFIIDGQLEWWKISGFSEKPYNYRNSQIRLEINWGDILSRYLTAVLLIEWAISSSPLDLQIWTIWYFLVGSHQTKYLLLREKILNAFQALRYWVMYENLFMIVRVFVYKLKGAFLKM